MEQYKREESVQGCEYEPNLREVRPRNLCGGKAGEPDPELNQNLKFVLERAKTYNVPKAIIERAIEKRRAALRKITTSCAMKASVRTERW